MKSKVDDDEECVKCDEVLMRWALALSVQINLRYTKHYKEAARIMIEYKDTHETNKKNMLIKEIDKHEYFQSHNKLCHVPSGTYTTEKQRLVTYTTFHNIAAHK